MKPENAMELSTAADLCEAAMEWALDMIEEKLPIRPKKERQQMFYGELHVPSQTLATAYYLTNYSGFLRLKYKNINIYTRLDTGYDMDEWSIKVGAYRYDKNGNPTHTSYIVWSPGA